MENLKQAKIELEKSEERTDSHEQETLFKAQTLALVAIAEILQDIWGALDSINNKTF